jgi:sigma-B regulation protein RsbU (phosphoserine phosphatase)
VAIRDLRLLRLMLAALVVAMAAALAAPMARSQTLDATGLRAPADLGGTWLVKGGDDPAYAAADFDDSQWLRFNPEKQSLHDLYPKTRQEVVWYRLHVKVDPSQTGLALAEYEISSAFDVYANGVELIKTGQVAPFKAAYMYAWLHARIPDEQVKTGSIVLALRVHVDAVEWGNAFPGYFPTNLTLGQQSSLREHVWLAVIGQQSLLWLRDLIMIALSLGAILLYSSKRSQQEYLWLFLFGLAVCVDVPLFLYGIFHAYPAAWSVATALSGLAWTYCMARMYLAFVGQRIGWRWQIILVLASVTFGLAVLGGNLGVMTTNQRLFLEGPWIMLEAFILPAVLLGKLRRGNREAGILLIPLLLDGLYNLLMIGTVLLVQIPALRNAAWLFSEATRVVHAGPFSIGPAVVLNMLAELSLALIILLRSNSQSRKQALLESEMAAAQQVQQVMLPEQGRLGQIQSVPGFIIESVYQPAQHVGGDFFQILPDSEGGLLIVVGDVAGKGLPAAMLVSVLVGAIRTAAAYSRSPQEVLAQLNDRLMGRTQGSFSTALAAHIGKDGRVGIANAGHLSPYLDGLELDLPGALPLGIVADQEYEATSFQLAAGSRLTFYSDGVVEAQSQTGELFGFERAKDISTQPAAAIAEAAARFGQSDDITVVAIQRQAALMSAASSRTSGGSFAQDDC